MLYRKRCIKCGKEFPRYAIKKGWQIVQVGRRGRGRRWYRNCGCMTKDHFYDMWNYLFGHNVNYIEDLKISSPDDYKKAIDRFLCL